MPKASGFIKFTCNHRSAVHMALQDGKYLFAKLLISPPCNCFTKQVNQTPFSMDVPNTPSQLDAPAGNGSQGEISNQSVLDLRRKRARERYASLSQEQKQARVQMNRERRQRRKDAPTSVLCQDASPSNVPVPTPTNVVLPTLSEVPLVTPTNVSKPTSTAIEGTLGDITNLSALERRRKRARDRYASLTPDQKENMLQKNREYRQKKREESTTINLSACTATVGGIENHQPVMTPRCPITEDSSEGLKERASKYMHDVEPMSCLVQCTEPSKMTNAIQRKMAVMTPRRLPFTEKRNLTPGENSDVMLDIIGGDK
uniref:Uncharacterized protein n=1 Tax=Leersia perrieri TaxID=77586 RepID=A0A0D9VVL3_9ORYZ